MDHRQEVWSDDEFFTESIDEVETSPASLDGHEHDHDDPRNGSLEVVEAVEQSKSSSNLQVTTAFSGMSISTLASWSPRFQFLSDDKTAQELNQLQESSAKRRLEFLDSVHGLSCRIAAVTAQLGQERMGRDKSLRQLVETANLRLEEVLDRVTLKQYVPISSADLDRRVTQLDVQMTRTLYGSMYDQVQSKLGDLQKQVDISAGPSGLRKEFLERSKQDSTLFRKVDNLVGDMARRYQEERASRLAAVELASYQIQEQEFNSNSGQKFLGAIQELRKHLALERQERLARDNALKKKIHKETESLKRALLDLAEDDLEAVDQQQIVLKF